jgi:hypothetical protein
MPYPNTKLYELLKEENRLLYSAKWWLHDEFRFNHAPFKPINMTADALTDLGIHCRMDFNSIASILYRSTDFKTNMRSLFKLAVFYTYSPLFRKEVYKKQSMLLGTEESNT